MASIICPDEFWTKSINCPDKLSRAISRPDDLSTSIIRQVRTSYRPWYRTTYRRLPQSITIIVWYTGAVAVPNCVCSWLEYVIVSAIKRCDSVTDTAFGLTKLAAACTETAEVGKTSLLKQNLKNPFTNEWRLNRENVHLAYNFSERAKERGGSRQLPRRASVSM